MNHPELRDHYELFALGLADDPESSEIREHLNRGCDVCVAEMRKAMELTALVGATAAPAAPSPKLRRRILASTGYEERRFSFWTLVAAATAVLACFAAVYFSGRENQFADESLALREQLRRQTIDLTRLNEAFAILSGPETTVTTFGAGPAPPKGKVFVNARQGVLLIASNLPPAPSGKVYEMWIIPKGGKPAPAGLFLSQADGTAMHVQRGAVDVAATGAVAVTLENDGGAAQPTSTPLIVAALER